MPKIDIKGLFYITHIDNVESILRYGIFSHTSVEKKRLHFTPIYDAQIVSHRREKITPSGKSLWEYANLYFQPRNPMLYRVLNEKLKKDIAIISVRPDILDSPASFISTGNAASMESVILPVETGLKEIRRMWKIINNDWWNDTDGSKRKIMAELLVPEVVSPQFIQTVYVSNHSIAETLREQLQNRVEVIPEPHMFFQPVSRTKISQNIFLVDGDMFFSTMQTLTISVNTVGIMGKGLASRAKYQFPDVYVQYQDACRSKKLQMGKPYLYKRESFIDEELADEPSSLSSPNSNKWFLLFATKKHWREKSDIVGIEQGLRWLQNNFKKLEIKSLAVPALGCGLGGLAWEDVGPLMCRYFDKFGIPVAIYLPRERKISREHLTREFLLGK